MIEQGGGCMTLEDSISLLTNCSWPELNQWDHNLFFSWLSTMPVCERMMQRNCELSAAFMKIAIPCFSRILVRWVPQAHLHRWWDGLIDGRWSKCLIFFLIVSVHLHHSSWPCHHGHPEHMGLLMHWCLALSWVLSMSLIEEKVVNPWRGPLPPLLEPSFFLLTCSHRSTERSLRQHGPKRGPADVSSAQYEWIRVP
jgi:hypothetical protein